MVIDSDNEDIIIQYSPMPDDNIASPSVCVKASDHNDDGDDNKIIPYEEEEDFESSHDDKKNKVDQYVFITDSCSDNDDDGGSSSLSKLSLGSACDSLQQLREKFTIRERNKVMKKLYGKQQKIVADSDGA